MGERVAGSADVVIDLRDKPEREFPWDLVKYRELPAPEGQLLQRVKRFSMVPPYPWGQWFYGRALIEDLARLDGDVIECGVGLGGMSLYLGLLLQADGSNKRVLSVDSFVGLPTPDDHKDGDYFYAEEYGPDDVGASLLESFETLVDGFGLAGRVTPIQGFFGDVLPTIPGRFSLVHIDGDLYESVMDALEALYDRVVPGGLIVIDDFFHPAQGPAQAVREFLNNRGIAPTLEVSFPYSVGFYKDRPGSPEAVRAIDGEVYGFRWLRDPVFVQALRESVDRAWSDEAKENSRILLDVVEADDDTGLIYDYWRALEPFWRRIDTRRADRTPYKLEHVFGAWRN